MTPLLRVIGTALLALALAACATGSAPAAVPLLRLSPAALGQTLALHQRLTVDAQGRRQQLEVALEADTKGVRLAVLDLGQIVARLEWDGRELQESRAAGWPEAVRGERILSDLQLVYWPAEAIRPALPAGWTLATQGGVRSLQFGDLAVMQVRYPAAGVAELENLLQGYRIRIDSRPGSATQ
jgi:hypothetical protein